MTKVKTQTSSFIPKLRVNGKGIHAKKKTSINPKSKNYLKPYRGQGRV